MANLFANFQRQEKQSKRKPNYRNGNDIDGAGAGVRGKEDLIRLLMNSESA